MRIESYFVSPVNRTQSITRTQKPERAQSASSSSEALTLSPTGRLFMAGQNAFRALPPVRDMKVQELSKQLASGQYRVHPESVASAIVNDNSSECGESQ